MNEIMTQNDDNTSNDGNGEWQKVDICWRDKETMNEDYERKFVQGQNGGKSSSTWNFLMGLLSWQHMRNRGGAGGTNERM